LVSAPTQNFVSFSGKTRLDFDINPSASDTSTLF
jgi:hypothetical protein